MYADKVTPSMKVTIGECDRRRKIQLKFNKEHNISPRSIEKAIHQGIEELDEAEELVWETAGQNEEEYALSSMVSDLERQMELAARNLEFEKAALIRDKIQEFKEPGANVRQGKGRGASPVKSRGSKARRKG
jgi:excinuclease ABC subunit B